ncbi:hypothetical protein GALMADRAFT_206817 [Galerina marginata CBS 339.88]|uniref:Uncharacterized protein n=1 Tax=Galerina marginata (strain CBS 339.88) TaxID=685588 RepID=A0A067TIY5_GALM3|nr:hypothetical protein GALMADRAFT_206817 [Galerina marginata CBS 339.88]
MSSSGANLRFSGTAIDSFTALPGLNTTSPFSRLPNGLLWNIFQLNSDMEDDPLDCDPQLRAVSVTRFNSQVCRTWRSLILCASSLWGRLIDLNSFKFVQLERMNENSKFHLFADPSHAPRLRDFRSFFMPSNPRDRMVVQYTPTTLTVTTWLLLLEKMPCLESLSLLDPFLAEDYASRHKICLSILEAIALSGDLQKGFIFLEHIMQGPLCFLEWRTSPGATQSEFDQATEVNSKYYKDWFNNNFVESLEVSVNLINEWFTIARFSFPPPPGYF